MAVTAGMIAKAAATALSNEKLRKGIGCGLVAVLSPVILLIAALCSIGTGGADHNNQAVAAAFYGTSYSSEVPMAFRSHIEEMCTAFSLLDSAVAEAIERQVGKMLENDVNEKCADSIIGDIENSLKKESNIDSILAAVYQKVILKLGEPHIITLQEDKPKVAFFIGPTGVGKTTTIAKIASKFKLEEHARVAFITSDTYRIAAVEQLNTYASIISCPVSVVYSAVLVLELLLLPPQRPQQAVSEEEQVVENGQNGQQRHHVLMLPHHPQHLIQQEDPIRLKGRWMS